MNLKFSPIKILIFLASFSISSFSFEGFEIGMYTKFFPTEWINTKVEASLINESFVKYDDKIYEIIAYRTGFVASKTPFEGFYLAQRGVKLFYFPSSKSESLQCYKDGTSYYGFYQEASKLCMGPTGSDSSFVPVTVSRIVELLIKPVTAACKANENFNTQTKKCEAPCGKGQSWDQDSNKCYIDCTDKAKNMWGYPDGSCMDCSKEKTYIGAAKCICKYFGKKFTPPAKVEGLQPVNGIPIGNGYYRETCDDGTQFDFKSPGEGNDEAPKYDNNSTQIGQDDGNKTKPQDQNSSNSSNSKDKNKDKDDNKTSPKDPKDPATPSIPSENGNQTATPANPSDPNGGGSNSGSGGGNSGGSNNNGSSGGTTIIDNGGSGSGKGNDKGDSYGTFNGKVDYSDLETQNNSFLSGYKDAISGITKGWEDFKNGLNQFIDNVKGNGMRAVARRDIPKSCPISRNVTVLDKVYNISIDFCKILEPISGSMYYLFYVIFFAGFLYLIVKISLFAF